MQDYIANVVMFKYFPNLLNVYTYDSITSVMGQLLIGG